MKPVIRSSPRCALVLVACVLASGVAQAQAAATTARTTTPVVYPARGQNPQVQDLDQYQCYAWARTQSGFDPVREQTAPESSTARAPGATGGLVRSAAVGAAIGELAHDDAGRGAATGALGGAALQGLRARQAATQQQQRAAQQQAARHERQSTFDRAFAACLEGRGYTLR